MTLKETEEYIGQRILLLYHNDEARSIAKIALQNILKLSSLDYSLNIHNEVPQNAFPQINNFIDHLQWGEPIQYVTGEANFMGYDFIVSPSVLIPRRETEELVDLIIKDNSTRGITRILDIGTGSGCIAIILKKFFPEAITYAFDISDVALDIALRNSLKLNVDIEFIQCDILELNNLSIGRLDIIVSNPPYVTNQEKEFMHKNVLEYEPHLALFVPDNNALIFYEKITGLAAQNLNEGGRLYFEVNENYASEVSKILSLNGFKDIQIVKDMQGKERIVKGML